MHKLLSLFTVVVACLSQQLQGSVPFVAEAEIVIYHLKDDDTREVSKRFLVTEARDAAGNRMKRQVGDGVDVTMLWEKASGHYYRLDHAKQLKVLLEMTATPPGVLTLPNQTEAASGIRAHRVNGIPCLRVARHDRSSGVQREIGFTCVSQELDGLTIGMEAPLLLEGKRYRMEQSLRFVHEGQVPPAEWFQIPTSYREGREVAPTPKD
jgi:hypothetical protein